MKKIFVLILVVCLAICSYARHDVIYLCQGDTYSWDLSEYCTSGDTLVCASGPVDWTVFYQEAQYDTVLGNQVILSPTMDRVYKLVSINGSDTMMGDCPVYLTIHIKTAPTIFIDSIKHVTCPDGWDYPYADGVFHVSLDDSVQNYAWINIEVDTPFFFVNTCYGPITLTNLRSATYHVFSHGVNGCVYHDSVTIEQPEAWYVDSLTKRIDTICHDSTGCVNISIQGGTPPYNYTWFYFEYNQNGVDTVFMEDTTSLVCGLYGGGQLYRVFMYDSKHCKAFGEEMFAILIYLFEWGEDSTHIITTDSIACYGRDFLVQAQSIGEGSYTWHVGGIADSTNYWTSIYGDSMFVADYYTPPITEPTWVYAEFSDQHHCVTRDSIWVEVYNSNISLTIQTPNIITDSTCTVHVSPPGGNLFVDGVVVGYSIPSDYTFSTAGIQVGPHTLRYAGTFGAEIGVACDDETMQTIQVQTHPFVTEWSQEITIYPNPATTVLNLSSTEMMNMIVSITDITGRVIQTEKVMDSFYVIDVSNLSSGIYLLRLESNDGASKSIKFVKR